MYELQEQHQKLAEMLTLVDNLATSIRSTFTGSREGVTVVDVDEYLRTRNLLLQLHRTYDQEVYRVCFEERVSTHSCLEGKRHADH